MNETVTGLVFPLIVLLVGALVSGVLLPRIVDARNQARKSLELRTSLVTEITQAVMSFLMAIQFAQQAERYARAWRETADQRGDAPDISLSPDNIEDAASKKGLGEANEAYKLWEIESAVIGTKLRAYFPDTGIGRRWTELSDDLVVLYGTLGVPEDLRTAPLKELRERHPGDSGRQGLLFGGLLASSTDLIRTVLATPPYLG